MANQAYTLKNGEIDEEVDVLRLLIGAGEDEPFMRRSSVWKFFMGKRGHDFFVTSSSIQGEMKGTVHLTRAQFGFTAQSPYPPKSWVGTPPLNRHYHTLDIPNLADGDFQHIFAISFPGFALLQTPQPLEPNKHTVRIEPPTATAEITFALTLVQGDWRQFQTAGENERYVGLLTGDTDRHALVSISCYRLTDATQTYKNMERNLALIDTQSRELPDGELSALLWLERQPNDPIRIIELGSIHN